MKSSSVLGLALATSLTLAGAIAHPAFADDPSTAPTGDPRVPPIFDPDAPDRNTAPTGDPAAPPIFDPDTRDRNTAPTGDPGVPPVFDPSDPERNTAPTGDPGSPPVVLELDTEERLDVDQPADDFGGPGDVEEDEEPEEDDAGCSAAPDPTGLGALLFAVGAVARRRRR